MTGLLLSRTGRKLAHKLGGNKFQESSRQKKETMEDVSLKFPPGGWGRKSMEKGQEMESFARDRTIGKYSLGDEGTE